MGEAITTAGIADVTILCRDDEKNMINLEDASRYFKSKPVKGEFTKFNFFSCRYNEGWDLEDDETATMVLFTDTTIPHSLVGIPYKGFQAVGRLRAEPHNRPHKIYHITNNFGKTGMNTLEHIQRTQLYNAQHHINQFNEHKAKCKKEGYDDLELLLPVIKPFVEFENEIANLDLDLLDQISCADYCREMYNSVETIKQGWEMTNYETERMRFNLPALVRSKKSPEEINKQVLDHINEIRMYPVRYVYQAARDTINKYKVEFQLLIEADEILGSAEVERLGYNNEAMKAALIEISNKNAEARLRVLMAQTFKLNEPTTDKRYTNKYIKEKMQQFYNELGLKKSNGSPLPATAKHLSYYGLFEVHDCKVDVGNGVKKPGQLIWRVNFTLKQAA